MLSKKRMYLLWAGSSVIYLDKVLHKYTLATAKCYTNTLATGRRVLGAHSEALAVLVDIADVDRKGDAGWARGRKAAHQRGCQMHAFDDQTALCGSV
jgi:hypothetical protein